MSFKSIVKLKHYMEDKTPEVADDSHEESNEHIEKKSHAEHEHSDKSNVNFYNRFLSWYKTHKKWSIPASVLLLVLLLFIVPTSRYKLAGTTLKQTVRIKIVDSTAHVPVSSAVVTIGSKSASTDANGIAKLSGVSVGHQKLSVSKKYYEDRSANILVPIQKQKTVPAVDFTATGRQVKVVVRDIVSQMPLKDIGININDQISQTDKDGSALVVVQANVSSQKATLKGDGYNEQAVTLAVSGDTIKENDYNMTPSGKVYFLSKLSGKIDVVKTNLDGSERKTVLAGTGREDDRGTVLLASRDWKYLALLSKRDSSQAKLYLINTTNDSLLTVDAGNATFTLVGWSDNNFVYSVNRLDIPAWQPHAQALKSYNAQTGQLLTLDQTNAAGTNNSDYAQESYGSTYLIGRSVVYDKNWNVNYYNQAALSDKKAGIYTISASGNNSATLKTFDYPTGSYTYINSIPYEADQIYYKVTQNNTDSYYAYSAGKVTPKDSQSDEFDKYYQNPQKTYLFSPSGDETFWSESRDGKYALFIGDVHGDNGKQIAQLTDYQNYGWFTDDYLLVSKNGSELYILPRSGLSDKVTGLKITDYHKPAVSFYGYGGGYGGL
jgi:hypothetical protein